MMHGSGLNEMGYPNRSKEVNRINHEGGMDLSWSTKLNHSAAPIPTFEDGVKKRYSELTQLIVISN